MESLGNIVIIRLAKLTTQSQSLEQASRSINLKMELLGTKLILRVHQQLELRLMASLSK